MHPGACPLMLRIAPVLNTTSLAQEIDALRWTLFENYGVPIPEITIVVEPAQQAAAVTLLLYQEPVLTQVLPEKGFCLAFGVADDLGGETVTLPDGMGQITWLPAEMAALARDRGLTVMAQENCLSALLRRVLVRYMAEFIGVQEARYLMDAMEAQYSELVKELQRQLPISKITETLQRLVAEGVSIRDLRLIFGTLIEWAPREKDVLMLTEYVRIALRRHLLQRLKPLGEPLPVVRIGEGIENLIRESIRQTAVGTYAALSPAQNQRILNLVAEALASLGEVCVVTSVDARRFLRRLIETLRYDIAVLSWQELGAECSIQVLTTLDLSTEELADDDM